MTRHRSLPDLVAWLEHRLRAPLPGAPAQRRFAPRPIVDDWAPDLEPETARRAAVLMLLYPGTYGPSLPLTLRRSTLSAHAGQVSLPGGAIDPGESVESAALREADEEIGVDPASVRVLGTLSPLWVSVSNFVVTPVVGVSLSAPAFRLHPHEVESLIEGPVSRLCDPSTVAVTHRQRDNIHIDCPGFSIDGHTVWGATAMMLGEFVALFETTETT
jgi:8-oxo-dGTP pyrophosphatase MutT (NUDIX family)